MPKKEEQRTEFRQLQAKATPSEFKKHLKDLYRHFFYTCKIGVDWGSLAKYFRLDLVPERPDLIDEPDELPFGGDATDVVDDYVRYSEINLTASTWSREYICLQLKRIYVLNSAILSAIQDALDDNRPDWVWPILSNYYDDSHL